MTQATRLALLGAAAALALGAGSTASAGDELADFATGGYATALRTMDMMHMIDADHDGRVSMQEWDAFQERSFATLDRDHDGYVEAGELMSPADDGARFATAAYARGLRSDALFRKMDTDSDGRISRPEFLAYQRKVFEMLGHGQAPLTPAAFLHVSGTQAGT